MTILIPDNAAWDTYLRDLGRNTTDIESFSDPAMRALFTELYPFFCQLSPDWLRCSPC